jgi:eukaryotic-like serine/threonine-protein kinase
MPFLGGGSLAEKVKSDGCMSRSAVMSWLVPIAGALDALHARGLVYGDVKPNNILFDEHRTPC